MEASFNCLASFLPTRFNPPPVSTQSISTTTAPPSQSDRLNYGSSDWKRIGKVVHIVGLGGFGSSVTLIVNVPSSAASHRALYMAYLVVVCLAITTSIGLSIFSILCKRSPRVSLAQKKLISLTFSFLVFSCFLRLQFVLPLADIGIVTTLVMIGLIFILPYLLIDSQYQHVNYPEPGENVSSVQA